MRLPGDILWEGEGARVREARRRPVMEVGGCGPGCGPEVGGDPRPGKAPDSERAGFCTAMIWPPLAERTCRKLG